MHSLETLNLINSPRESAKLARANRLFNSVHLHAKASEKTGARLTPASWTTDAQWERKMKREGKRVMPRIAFAEALLLQIASTVLGKKKPS